MQIMTHDAMIVLLANCSAFYYRLISLYLMARFCIESRMLECFSSRIFLYAFITRFVSCNAFTHLAIHESKVASHLLKIFINVSNEEDLIVSKLKACIDMRHHKLLKSIVRNLKDS